MYGGGYIHDSDAKKTTEVVQDDPQMLADFQARIDRGEKLNRATGCQPLTASSLFV